MRINMYNDITNYILNKLPLKYHERFTQVVKEDDLIDDCKYIVYLTSEWSFMGYNSVPVKTKSEAIKIIKESTKYVGL